MKKHHSIFGILVFFVTMLSFAGFSTQTAQAEQTNFTQVILPLECVVSTVQTGTNTTTSYTQDGCGTYVPSNTSMNPAVASPKLPVIFQNKPSSSDNGNYQNPVNLDHANNIGHPSGLGQKIILNDIGSLYRLGGFLVENREGSEIIFVLQGRPNTYTARVIKITNNGIVLQIEPGQQIVRLEKGKKSVVRLDANNSHSVHFRLETVAQDKSGYLAYLRVQFPSHNIKDGVVVDKWHAIAFALTVTSILVVASHLFHRYVRSPIEHRLWLNHKTDD